MVTKGKMKLKAPTSVRQPSPRKRGAFEESFLEKVSNQAIYIGSAEHKIIKGYAGDLNPRGDAEKCPPGFSGTENQRQKVEAALRDAIRKGQVSSCVEGGFPRFVWCDSLGDGLIYEARLTNRDKGEYKGYPRSDLQTIPQ